MDSCGSRRDGREPEKVWFDGSAEWRSEALVRLFRGVLDWGYPLSSSIKALPAFSNLSLPLAVVVAATRWDEPPRMRHQVTRQLMRWCNVLFVEFFPAPGDRKRTGFVRHGDRLIAYAATPHCALPIRLYANELLTHGFVNRRFVRDILIAMASVRPPSNTLLFNFVYDFHEIMRQPEFGYKAYVCFDEFPRMWRETVQPSLIKFHVRAHLFQHYENRVARAADRCLASHTPLVARLNRMNPQTTPFLHGHEFADAMPIGPRDKKGGDPIRAAYMGYITYNLLLEWIEAVLRSPDIHFYLIGPVCKFDAGMFDRYPNLHHVGPLAGEDLRRALADMDVLTMPYNPGIPEVNVQMVSNKFFQYVACCRPVVISDMPHYIDLPQGVLYRAKTADEFVDTIRRAHAEDCDEFRALRAWIAAENTWDKRGEQLRATIERDLSGIAGHNE